ncbi:MULTISPECIES: transaldolase family protein [unclassified Nitrospina]|uniref:transaldolase family protein n=1 Tax=unclassified Nitrospina TaxID=2638683 RepID=UPI003F9ACD2E
MGTISKELDDLVHSIAARKIDGGDVSGQYESDPLLARLKELGSELWIDTGDLELAKSIWHRELSALTTNNTLANQVVQTGIMDDLIKETVEKLNAAASGWSEDEQVREVGFVINCRIALRLVEAFKVKVSVELHPKVSRDLEATLDYARRYYKVCPEYFIVKIPLTPEGYLAVRTLRKEGIPINFTLGFSARQNYLAARLSNPNYLNVFLGRLNAVVGDNKLGDGSNIGEKVTFATQHAVREAGKQDKQVTSKLIAASIRNGDQVAALAGVDVQTIPPKAMQEFQKSGRKPEEVKNILNTDLKPGVDMSGGWGSQVARLWQVEDTFKQFVDTLLKDGNPDGMGGEDLVKFSEKSKVDLFHRFSDGDLKKIYDHGKIPQLADWPETVALDDLMTQSALQSFTKDQDALDDRIRSFLK